MVNHELSIKLKLFDEFNQNVNYLTPATAALDLSNRNDEV